MMTHYLLDTSALACHFLRAPGHPFVNDCLRKGSALCALSVFEFALFLKKIDVPDSDGKQVWDRYRSVLHAIIPVDETLAELALQLRQQTTDRLPAMDACIAACAARHQWVLVHADHHYTALPGGTLSLVDLRALPTI